MITTKENDVIAMTEEFWFGQDKPLVSCLMLTYNRFGPFKKALECFLKQIYTNKQLIIVNSGNKSYNKKVHKLVTRCMSVCKIKYIPHAPVMSIGELRNFALKYCDGEYVICFDDDDIHHPMRIARQIDLCLKSNIQGTILKNFTAKIGWKEHKCSILHGLEGSLLFKNPKGKIQYTDMNQGEDTDFIKKLRDNEYNIAVIDEDFDTYKYIHHRTNTVSKKHFKNMIELNVPVRR